jgi:hypothetical protein
VHVSKARKYRTIFRYGSMLAIINEANKNVVMGRMRHLVDVFA